MLAHGQGRVQDPDPLGDDWEIICSRRATTKTLAALGCEVFIAGVTRCASRHTWRRRARYRVGNEGRISHLKRSYHVGRSRLRGIEGARIWESWAVFAYDLDTVALMPTK